MVQAKECRNRFCVTIGLIVVHLFFGTAIARTFYAEGSDILLGVGARNIAMAGAVTAETQDVYAAYWNPAGLSRLNQKEIVGSLRLGAELLPVNFLGAAFVIPQLGSSGWKMTYAFAFIPRLHIFGDGTFREDEFESIFMRYALPSLKGNFTGRLESKTKDYRMAFGFAPIVDPKLRLGFSIGYVDCATVFCGVTAEDPGNYIISSTGATAWTFNVGAQYQWSERLAFGFNLNDVNSSLDVEIVETDNTGTTVKHYDVEFPRDVSLGVVYQYSASLLFSADFRFLAGKYGDYVVDFRTLRVGLERKRIVENVDAQFGLLMPLKLASDKTEELDPPYFAAPSAGLSWMGKQLRIDSAFFVEPISSYQSRKVKLAMEVAARFQF